MRLPNLPLHFWGLPLLEAIGPALGKFHFESCETSRHNTSTFARICVEMNFSKGFPSEVILTGKNYSWSQKLDYERIFLRCRSCFETRHLASHCPKEPKMNRKPRKSTWWVGSNDDHQVISKPPQSSEKMSHPDLPPLPTPSQKSTKEVSSPQIFEEGPRLISSPQLSASWADLTEDAGVLDEEKIEALDQDNLENPRITSTSTNANESWTIVRKNKTSHATSQPMIT